MSIRVHIRDLDMNKLAFSRTGVCTTSQTRDGVVSRRPVWVCVSGHDDNGPPAREGCASHGDVIPQRHMVRK